MATVNFSVPETVKARFNKTFRHRNKSAVLSRLMEQAIEEEERSQRRRKAVDAVLALRTSASPVSAAAIDRARRRGRP